MNISQYNVKTLYCNQFSGDNRAVAPPDSISNSEVKRSIADGSVGSPCESRTSPEFKY